MIRALLIAFVACISCDNVGTLYQSGESDRSLGMEVCYNPSSIWHLSDCNELCMLRDYTGNAMCFYVNELVCLNALEEYVRQACALRGM